jgi:tRNA(Ile)-lysidine synthase
VSLLNKAEDALKQECPIEKGAAILVACSGGADSVALLHFLHSNQKKLGIGKLGVYHLNHGLRGAESDADERFVAELAESFGIDFHPDSADVAAYAAEHGISLEMAGRKLRYAGIDKLMKSEGCVPKERGCYSLVTGAYAPAYCENAPKGYGCYGYTALGHTASDNAEWIILSLLRGRAEPALWGIPARRGHYIRPLIRCTREEVLTYLAEHKLSFREDSSNACLSFDRNRVRHRIIPLLRELNPSFEQTLSRTLWLGDICKSALDVEAANLLRHISVNKGKVRKLDTSGLSGYNPATQLRVLRLFAPWLGVSDLLRLMPLGVVKGTREIARSGGKKLSASYGLLVLEECDEQPVWESFELAEGNDVFLPGLGWRVCVHKGDVEEHSSLQGLLLRSDAAYFDASVIAPPFIVRAWREGDRMIPFGRHSEVKLKRIFIDRKVPREVRRRWPLVCKGAEILWIAGLLRSAAAPVTDSTRKLTILSVLRGENDK